MARNALSPNYEWLLLAEQNLNGKPTDQELATAGALIVADCVKNLDLPQARLERLKMAVQEAVTNLFRRGGPDQPSLPLAIRVYVKQGGVGFGSYGTDPRSTMLAGETPLFTMPAASGWGFFLVEKVADATALNRDFPKFNGPTPNLEPLHHAVEVFLYAEGESASLPPDSRR